MNPGPVLGAYAVAACYTVVLGALVLYIVFMARKRKRLVERRKELQGH
jgi:hypothetical protein